MTNEVQTPSDVLEFWNSRAGLGSWAGTRDVIAKQLEIEALAALVHDDMNVLEVGCGNGISALEIARRHRVNITAIDFAANMIAEAKRLASSQKLKGSVEFRVGDVRQMESFPQRFDLIYTERVLINLPDWESQCRAIADITELLSTGGLYAMCENSQDGLDAINNLRVCLRLPVISPPWHNRYLRDIELAGVNLQDVTLEQVQHYSSTYYFLSRVVNAALAQAEGREPDYENRINKLALALPSIANIGQGRLWLWRKSSGKK